jgi:hypothetical protein
LFLFSLLHSFVNIRNVRGRGFVRWGFDLEMDNRKKYVLSLLLSLFPN